VEWSERIEPDMAFQKPSWCTAECGKIMPWEHVLLAANELGSGEYRNAHTRSTD
jgi:hypothetical protein